MQGLRDNQLGGREVQAQGAKPALEIPPDGMGVVDCQMLQDALSDTTELDMEMISPEFAADGLSILG